MDDVKNAGYWVLNFFEAHPWILITLIAHVAILGLVAYLILLERWTASWVQDRLGPNRVGLGFGIIPWLKDMKMHGLGQPLADGAKFLLKEDYQPAGVDKVLFTAAPIMMIIVVIMSIAVLPWGGVKQTTRDIDLGAWAGQTQPAAQRDNLDARVREYLPEDSRNITHSERVAEEQKSDGSYQQHLISNVTYQYNFQSANLNIGVLFILAVLSLAVYGVVIGGWASNNKYSFLGGLRATANMISYEIPLGLAVLCVVIMFGTLDLADIIARQTGGIWHWNVFSQPVTFILFLICIHAEANRAPFDLAEAEQELVGGYHTEYSAMRFALFFLGEYAGMVTTSVVCVALFFGGWYIPGVDRGVAWISKTLFHSGAFVSDTDPTVTNSLLVCIVRAVVFIAKTIFIIFTFMWVRWSLPRFRFDQLMGLAWRALIPISLGLLVMTTLVVFFFGGAPEKGQYLPAGTRIALLAANGVFIVLTVIIAQLLPKGPETNRRIRISNSRFATTPLPAGTIAASSN